MVRFLKQCALMLALIPSTMQAQAAAQAGVGGAAAQPVVMPAAPLLPEMWGAWHAKGDASNAIALNDAVAKELIAVRSAARAYTSLGGDATVSAVEFTDATGAFSAFTLLRTPSMRPCAEENSLGKDCAVAAGRLLFWQGDTVVSIAPAGTKPIAANAFHDLVGALPKPRGAKAAMPLLPTRLPPDGLQRESLRYAVGPLTYAAQGGLLPAAVIDFGKSPEILTSQYGGMRTGNGVLTTIFYPTPQIAADRMRAVEAAIKDGGLPASFMRGEPQVARSGPIVVLASSGFTAKQAEKLVKGVKYQADITWNKPEGYMEQFKVSNAAGIIAQIMVFVFVMVGAALALGIVFGGGRAAFRRARGKPISSIDDMEVISLGLRGKPERKLQ
jgi:hypothetical protein